MNNQNVETTRSTSDTVLVSLAVISAVAGVIAFSLMTDQSLGMRLAALGGGVVLGIILAWFSPSGKELLNYGTRSWDELRRVIWPTRKETLNTTGLVMAFVFVIAMFLWICDMVIEWGLYDVLLRIAV